LLDDDSFLTETLAQVYIKQKKYEQALTIIKRLSLNFPKKSIYFADQIRFLEYLIYNEKNKK
ncbi:MAG: tetratricopeptide repeat protein, partial [Bacteroidales bacterium]|nr:tetratricopeptide repeat protein [Bacteroidales bacterium]